MSASQASDPDRQEPTKVGLHTISRERDLNIVRLHGAMSIEEAAVFHAMVASCLGQYGTAFVLVDSRAGGTMPPETRRWIAEWNQAHQISGVAIFGGSLVMRTMLTLLLNAIGLLRRQRVPSAFVKTEAEARAWLKARALESA